MYDETNVPGPEFKVRAVTRYVVTRYYHPYRKDDALGGVVEGYSQVIAEVPREEDAIEIAQNMVKALQHIGATLSL